MCRRFWLIFLCLVITNLYSQNQSPQNAIEIYRDLQALNVLGTVMYIAAHPDDENTRLISYFSNKIHAQTYYLALTRGDGGQNLLGSDLKEALGIIRTQELLKARSIDGGQQRFTRAVDFGYSKSPEETLSIWNKDSVLSDMVWTIRKIKPDIIINRFDHRTAGTTHGHHTASAMLSLEAFDMAADPSKFSNQLLQTEVWQPQRLFFNTSWWFYGSRDAFKKADKSNLMTFDIGEYYPQLGLSNSEIASLSRSQHKSQAFGNTPRRGKQMEYLEIIKGGLPQTNNIFEDINTSWSRIKGGKAINNLVNDIISDFDFSRPYRSVPKLIEAHTKIQELNNEHWKQIKTQEINDIIISCLGLYIESVTEQAYANTNETIKVKTEIVNRSPIDVQLLKIKTKGKNLLPAPVYLDNNQALYNTFSIQVPDSKSLPYWLNKPSNKGLYQVENKSLIGLPTTPNPLQFEYVIRIDGQNIKLESEVFYKYNDPVDGEVFEEFEILPQISILPSNQVVIFKNAEHKNISVQVQSFTDDFEGELNLGLPEDWMVSPTKYDFHFRSKGEIKSFNFQVSPPKKNQKVSANFTVNSNQVEYSKQIKILDYNHIPKQYFVQDAKSAFVNINVNNKSSLIGYIKGAGDKIPQNLENLGFRVKTIDLNTIYSTDELQSYDAIVLGIRAYNTEEQLITKNEILFDYVKEGGTLLTQYTTTYGLLTDKISPLTLNLSRKRVTNEEAKVNFLEPEHPVLNYPNTITSADFKGWVQERGLYFPDDWSNSLTPILEIQDYSEEPTKGSLLVGKYGKGFYIYTGLSLFRQLPAGVPGAFRLMSNLLSIQTDE